MSEHWKHIVYLVCESANQIEAKETAKNKLYLLDSIYRLHLNKNVVRET